MSGIYFKILHTKIKQIWQNVITIKHWGWAYGDSLHFSLYFSVCLKIFITSKKKPPKIHKVK